MPLVEPPYTLPGAWTNCYIPLNSQRKAMDVRWLPTLPGPPFLGSTQMRLPRDNYRKSDQGAAQDGAALHPLRTMPSAAISMVSSGSLS